MTEDARWGGVVAVGAWWLLYTGVYGPTGRHAHHAVQVITAQQDVMVRCEAGEVLVGRTMTIPSDHSHEIVSSGVATMVFIDADSSTGRRLNAPGEPAVGHTPIALTAGNSRLVVETVLAAVAPDVVADPAPVTREIAAVLAELADDPDAGTLDAFAAKAGMSSSRFSQRFAREVGLPLRSYRRWTRMVHAIEAVGDGATLTAAAHRAGFVDSAHLSHTFRDHFGLAPTDLFAGSRFEQA